MNYEDYDIIEVPLRELRPMVEAEAWPPVLESIKERGLEHPIVAIWTDATKWAEEKRNKYPQILDAPAINFRFLQVRFGHNRLRAYKELGKETIPCIIAENAEEAASIGKEQAKWQKQNLGPL